MYSHVFWYTFEANKYQTAEGGEDIDYTVTANVFWNMFFRQLAATDRLNWTVNETERKQVKVVNK